MGKNEDPGSGINIPDPQHCQEGKNDPENLEKNKKFHVLCSLLRAESFVNWTSFREA
jgi:hypothetical protein